MLCRSIDFWHILNSAAHPTEQAMQSEAPSSKYTMALCSSGLREERDVCIAERMSVSEEIDISVPVPAPNRRFNDSSPNVCDNDKRQQCRLDDTLLFSFTVLPTTASFVQSEKHLPVSERRYKLLMFIYTFPEILFTFSLGALVLLAFIQAICVLCRGRNSYDDAQTPCPGETPKEAKPDIQEQAIQVLVVSPTGSLSLGMNQNFSGSNDSANSSVP